MIVYRGFIVKPSPVSPQLVSVATEGKGGKIPAVLGGLFTSYSVVKAIIDRYLDSGKKRGKEDVSETVTEGGA